MSIFPFTPQPNAISQYTFPAPSTPRLALSMVIIHASAVAIDVDVMIISTRPTGLILALELSLQYTSFWIINKAIDRSNKSQALIIQPQSLELFSRYNSLVENFISISIGSIGVNVYINKSLAIRIDL